MGPRSEREKQLNFRKWRSLTFICMSFLALIISHQNCAPMPMAEGDELPMHAAQPVTVIDDIKSDAGLSFKTNRVEVPLESNYLPLEGICSHSQDGAIFSWRMINSDGAELYRNRARCQDGTFMIELDPAAQIPCGEDHMIIAQLGFAEAGTVIIHRQCIE